jgi:hypothetical protein
MELSGQLQAPVALAAGEIVSDTYWIGGWVGPRAGLHAVETREILTLQSVTHRYTD